MLRAVVIVLCIVGVLGAVQRTFITTSNQPRDAAGFTPIENTNLDASRRLAGITLGSARDTDLVSGFIAFEQKYERYPGYVLLHVIPGGLLFLLAPFQFSSSVRRRYPAYHRWSGRVLLVAMLGSSIAAFAFGLFMPFAGWSESLAVPIFGSLFLGSGIRAWLAIRRRDVTTHREWMTRMFATAIGIATTRVVSLLLAVVATLDLRSGFLTSLWIGFTASVAVGEVVIRRARPRVLGVRGAEGGVQPA